MAIDVQYDLSHESRLRSEGNWTVSEKEDIFSGVLQMDTILIGFVVGEFYGLSCCVYDAGNGFLYGKNKEKVYITSGPDFGGDLSGKNLIINMSLYGLKTSKTESSLRLDFKKISHEPDFWIVDKASKHTYLDTQVDEILI
jgi:hypothetical protein